MDFATAKTLVLSYIRRPAAEAATEVGDAINRVVQQAASSHDFLLLERMVEGLYTATTARMALSSLFSGNDVRFIKSLQVIPDTGELEGEAIKFVTYEELQSYWQRATAAGGGSIPNLGYSSYVAYMFGAASDAIQLGLYPVPDINIYLLAQLSLWPATLSADADTNFFLDKFPNYILFATCAHLFYYLRSDDRAVFSREAVNEQWDALVNWDRKLRASSGAVL